MPPVSIFVHPPTGNQSEPTQVKTSAKVTANLVTSPQSDHMQRITEAYRLRYASYIASTFHISKQAAEEEAAYQLQPRRVSEASESEIYRD